MNKLPLLWLSLAFLGGIITASLALPAQSLLFFLFASGVLTLLIEFYFSKHTIYIEERKRVLPLPIGLLVLVFTLGMLRVQTSQFMLSPEEVSWYNERGQTTLIAKVIAPPLAGERFTQVRVEAEQVVFDQPIDVDGRVLLWLPNSYAVAYGERLRLVGELQTPSEDDDFSYKDYLSRQGIHSLMPFPKISLLQENAGNWLLSIIYSLRDNAHHTLRRIFPMPESSLFSGILLGIQSDIPDYLYKGYQASGTAHILVISGFNISILAALFLRFFRRILPYGWDTLGALLAISLYTLLVGAQPPVMRAAIMGCLGLPAYLFGRCTLGLHTLAFTAAIMLLVSPALIGDVSFQLSFLATLGIFCFADPLQNKVQSLAAHRFSEENIQTWFTPLSEYLLITLAAQFAALPAIIFHFGYFSVFSLLGNILILPVQPLIMVLGGVSLLVGLLIEPLGQILAWFAWWPARYSDRMALFLGGLPNAVVSVPRNMVWITTLILIICLIPAVRYQFSPQTFMDKQLSHKRL